MSNSKSLPVEQTKMLESRKLAFAVGGYGMIVIGVDSRPADTEYYRYENSVLSHEISV